MAAGPAVSAPAAKENSSNGNGSAAAAVSTATAPTAAASAVAASTAAASTVAAPVHPSNGTSNGNGSTGPGSTLRVPLNLKAVKASLQAKPKETEQASKQAAAAQEEAATPYQQRDFSLRELQEHWQAFFIRLKENGSPIELMLASAALQVEENYKIDVLLSSSLQEEPFERLRPKLQHYLRQQLQNSQISLHPILVEESGPRKLYTNSEKFKHLMERYPLLAEFKERLGLETDF
ncbi:hypothetical protein [Cesiribacter sp. SM1]|uniref:hypothetical protein n=1 Tax=Cesiribacter sp. SM1 TaxID=2861196 RepID=UPI001CD7E12B|nr:hypothetical protein [Cesiribacter sp. SM1]